jgi:Uma2 family endonuclease
MGALKWDHIDIESYLNQEMDRDDGTKYEYVNGLVYAMAGASRNHNRISGNIFLGLATHLRNTNCQVFQSDMKVAIRNNNDERFYYPDVQVTCEDEQDPYYNTSPRLIVEVLSNSTVRTDRNEKRQAYCSIPSLQEYVLCSQDFPAIEVYRRRTQWQIERYLAGQTVMLASIDLNLPLDEIYDFLLADLSSTSV